MSDTAAPTPSTLQRLVATAVNGAEYLRYGGLGGDAEHSPFEVVSDLPLGLLRRYFPDDELGKPVVLLVPPLGQVAEVWDISPATSVVGLLREQGIDPWVVDFGDPETDAADVDRSLTNHVLAVSAAIDEAAKASGRDVHVLGYSQGGLIGYQTAAYRNCESVGSVITLGSPLGTIPTDKYVPDDVFWRLADSSTDVLRRTGLPRWLVSTMFNWMQPHRKIKTKLDYLKALHDRDALLPREPQRKFLETGAWIGWAGPAMAELLETMQHDRYRHGGLVYDDRAVGLADLTCPVLMVLGTADFLAPPERARMIVHAAPRADVHEMLLPVGHFGLPVSSHARKKTWPGVGAWVRWIAEPAQSLPDFITAVDTDSVAVDEPHIGPRGRVGNVTYGLSLAVGAGLAAPGALLGAAHRSADTARDLTFEAVEQLPQLIRLERMRPSTRISYGKLLADLAHRHRDEVSFLYAGRAYTRAETNERMDNVVAGLLSLGVRKGERVGVLMGARPSALAAVAALNRIGAVAVLLRPGSDVTREAELGQVTSVLTDPDHAAAAVPLGLPVWVLGGGAARELPAGVVDMEQIDPAAVALPSWYRPNPGRARDLAFVLFTGRGARLRADHIGNGRWATSALAAAAAARLSAADTVYSANPLHHPSGLMLATASAAAGGARLAMAEALDPNTFWTEVRRYGATVVPYTWTMLHALLAEPPRAEEAHHPIRLFIGSGMPAGLWARVADRFPTAAVLELYASTRTDAILGNVSGHKIGAIGKPLPGTPAVRVAAYDPDTNRLVIGSDGYVAPAAPGATGMLLVAAQSGSDEHGATVLRGVFRADDAWIVTGDLFRWDRDGDLWFVDHAAALIGTAAGTVSPRTVEDALGSCAAVDLAACYPVAGKAVAAVLLRPGAQLETRAITQALASIEPADRPDLVHVVESMPVTSWHRPDAAALAAAGLPTGIGGTAVWARNRHGGYRAVKAAA